jgi:hypothetical protein
MPAGQRFGPDGPPQKVLTAEKNVHSGRPAIAYRGVSVVTHHR